MRISKSWIVGALCLSGAFGACAQTGSEGAPAQARPSGPVRISSGVMQGQLLYKVSPEYPVDAKASGLQGMVVLHAIIGRDGHVERLEAISGPDALKSAALDAVKQWTYRPYLLNGEPTEVDTTVIVNFSLSR